MKFAICFSRVEVIASRTALTLLLMAMSMPLSRAQVTNGLVGLWSFNGDATDSSGNGNDAVLVNGASLDADVPAALGNGQSLRVGGGTQHALVPHDASLDITEAITIAAWVKPAGTGWGAILAKSPSDGGGANQAGNYELRLQTGGNQSVQWLYEEGPGINSTVTLTAPGVGPTVGQWNHVALTHDSAGNYTYYLNGQSTGSGTGPTFGTLTNNSPLYLGTRADLFTTINGHLDEVGLWNRVLSGPEVAQLAVGPVFAGPIVGLTQVEFSSSISEGGAVSMISSSDPGNPDDTYTYALVAGDGDSDNDKFQIVGGELQAGTHDFGGDADGTTFAVRIAATGTPSGETGSASFTLTLSMDSDGDSLPDEYELQWAADLTRLSGLAAADADADGLTDLQEFNLAGQFPSLDPTDEDSDGDTLLDGEEISGAGARPPTDPTNADTDGDNLSDRVETTTGTFAGPDDTGTDPTLLDSDDDGLDDASEVAVGTDPTDSTSFPPVQMVGLWRFEGNADDSSGLENHGELMDGAVLSDDVPDALGDGESLRVAGGTQHVLVPHDVSLDLAREITIAAWVKPAAAGWGAILAKNPDDLSGDNHAGNYELRLQNNSNQTLQWLYEPGPNASSTVTLSDSSVTGPMVGEWSHVAVTHDEQNNYTYYLNGVATSTGSGPAFGKLLNANPLYIGSRADFFTTLDGYLDDVALFNRALGQLQIQAIMDGDFSAFGLSGRSKLQLDIDLAGGELEIKWPSQFGKLYNLRSSMDPTNDGDPAGWPVFNGYEDLEATPDLNTLRIPVPPEPKRFFVIEEFPKPPTTLLSEDFETGAPGWTMGSDGAVGTMWEIGVPTAASGPAAANAGDNCAGTNLADDYLPGANVWLRSPAIDLTGVGGATLNFAQYRDIEDFGTSFASISVVSASDDALLAEIETGINGFPFQWERESFPVPSSVLGQQVKFEFRLISDEFAGQFFGGYYIDDFQLTVP